MSKVRVYEVAKQLNMDQKTLVGLFQSMGIGDVRNHMSAVEQDVVERLKRQLERQKAPEVVEERIRPTVVKRRARATEGDAVPEARPSSPRPSAPQAAAPPATAVAPSAPRPAASHAAPSAVASPPPAPSVRQVEPAPKSAPRREAPPASRPAKAAPPSKRGATKASSREAIPPPPVEASSLSFEDASGAAPARSTPRDASLEALAGAMVPSEPVAAAAAAKEAPARAPSPVPAPPAAPEEAARAPKLEQAAAPHAEAPASAAPATLAAGAAAAAPRAPTPAPASPARAEAPARVEPRVTPPPAAPPPPRVEEPRRPSSPPRTGIDVWQGRPGVPMPVPPRSPSTLPGPRRTTYDPRAGAQPARPGGAAGYGPGRGPSGPQSRNRPGFGRPRPGGPMMPSRKPHVSTAEMGSHKKVIKIEEQINLQNLASKMGVKATDVLMKLLSMGMTGVHINSTLDSDTAKILASEFGWTVEDVAVSEVETLTAAMTDATAETGEQEPRPPIVTVMGHVDHGKTSLLDRIRKATVADGEAGGITQHVGAYRVETARGTIAFLDTPGHEAFTAMRARGASLTDLVILVVAADDGVMPQTREAIAHAQAAHVPIVVALNKMDKPNIDADKIKRELAALGLQPEEWGGETMFVPVSAKTGMGVEQLLEGVLLQAEVLELRASTKKRANGTVIESLLDRGRGPVARVMVQDGTLRVGDIILAGGAWGKVRAMTDELGRPVGEAGPSTPVEVLGLNEVPSAGDPVHAVKDARTAEEIAETRRKKANKPAGDVRVSLEDLKNRLTENEQLELKLVIKADVQGSVEALAHAFAKLTNPKVKVSVVHSGVGGITEGDVNLAVASKAVIVGFNVRPAGKSASLAESEGIEIRLYNIIYNAVDDIKAAMEGLLPATRVEKTLGRAEVRQIFRLAKFGLVCGCMVQSGVVRRTADARLIRDSVVVWTGKLSGLRRFKDDVKEVAEGFECGISIDGYQDIKESDVIECFEVEEIKTKLF
jgi:translation initiation factor IF-2